MFDTTKEEFDNLQRQIGTENISKVRAVQGA